MNKVTFLVGGALTVLAGAGLTCSGCNYGPRITALEERNVAVTEQVTEQQTTLENAAAVAREKAEAAAEAAKAPVNESFRCYGPKREYAWCVPAYLTRTASVAGSEVYHFGNMGNSPNDYVRGVFVSRDTGKSIDTTKCQEQIGVSTEPVYLKDVWDADKMVAYCGEDSFAFGYCVETRDIDCQNKL